MALRFQHGKHKYPVLPKRDLSIPSLPPKEVPFRIQYWGTITSIITGFISMILAGWAIWLTIESSSQKQEIKDMNRVIEQLVEQNSKADKQIRSLDTSISTLRIIAGRTNQLIAWEAGAHEMKFRAFAISLFDHLMPVLIDKKWDSARQMAFFDGAINLFAEVATNPYLLSHKDIYNTWFTLYADLRIFKGALARRSSADLVWWDKAFPFKSVIERMFVFYMNIQGSSSENYRTESKDVEEFTYRTLEGTLTVAIEDLEALSIYFKEQTREILQTEYEDMDSTLTNEERIILKNYFTTLVDSIQAVRFDIASLPTEFEDGNADMNKFMSDLKNIFPTTKGIDKKVLTAFYRNGYRNRKPPVFIQTKYKELIRTLKELNSNFEPYRAATLTIFKKAISQLQ